MKKKRLITLLLAVIMVMSLLPMSAFAGIYDYDVTHPYETRYVLRGTQWLTSRNVVGLFTKDVPANWKYDNKDNVETINMECVVVTMEPRKKVVFAEPGSKFLITAGDVTVTGGTANFLVNDGLGTKKSIDFPIASQSNGIGDTFNEANYVPAGSVSATYGTDFVKGWRGNLVSRNGRLIEIKPDAVCDPEHPHVVKIKGEWGAGATGYVYLVIADKQDIVNMISKDTQKRSKDPIYSVDLTCLGDSQRIPSEPSTVDGRDWWKFYPSGDTLKLAYNKSGDGLTQLNRVKISLKDQHYADNALTAGIIKTDIFTTLPGYTAAIDGTNTGGIADATGVKTKAALNLTDADYQSMLNWLYSLAQATRSSTTKASFDDISNRYFLKAGKDSGTADNLQTLYTADHKNLADISSTDIAKYEVIPYVVKLQTQRNIGWKVDCAIVPNKDYRVQYIYDLNTPQGLSLDGIAAPSGDVALINESLVANIEAPTVSGTAMTVGQEYTFYDINDNAIRVRFNGWTLDNNSTPIYTPGQSKDLTSSTPRLYTFKGNWTVLNETVIVNKEVKGTDAEDVDFTFTFDFEDGASHNAYVVDKYGLPVGLNEEDGSHPSSDLTSGSTMTLKGGQSIYIENVAVGTTVTVTEAEDTMPDDYSTRQNTVVITPDGQPTQTAKGYYVYEQSDKITNLYGYYYVVHSSDPTAEPISKPLADTNIVEDVYDGYLYAGYYTDDTYKTAYSASGDDFDPVAGKTYYLKEISNNYARSAAYVIYRPNYTGRPITGIHLITAMDDSYKECGFILSDAYGTQNVSALGKNLEATREKTVLATYTVVKADNTKTFFSTLSNKILDAATYTDPAKGANAVQATISVPDVKDGTYVAVYYVTPDDVTVYGNVIRQIANPSGSQSDFGFTKVDGASYDKDGWHGIEAAKNSAPSNDVNPGAAKKIAAPAREVVPQAAKSITRSMAAKNVANDATVSKVDLLPVYETISMAENGSTLENKISTPTVNVVEAPETPAVDPETPAVDPETPAVDPEKPAVDPEKPAVDPETPAVDPEDPAVDPETPAEAEVTVSVNVNGVVTEVKGDSGDYTGKIEAPKQENKIFAGWYTDEECTQPADLTNVKENVTLYAKFIKASDVKVSTIKTKLFSNSFRTVVNASGDFVSASFVCKVNGKEINVDGTKTANGFVGDWGTSIKLGSKVVITPTFVTADGTTVYGDAKTFTYILGLFI